MIIAIDGPAAAGKGTLARALAKKLNLAYLDTGGLYRAVALGVIDDNLSAEEASENLDYAILGSPKLRQEHVGEMASKVAAIPKVRENLLCFQRRFASHPPNGYDGAVLDGRDIGTVVVPDADIKFFITANDEIRAKRRYKELIVLEKPVIYSEILSDIRARDSRDKAREVAPLLPADDAITVDTSTMDEKQVLDHVSDMVRKTLTKSRF